MPDYYSSNMWSYNCPPGKNDLDAYALWQAITIQRNQLRRIVYASSFWNARDNTTETKQNVLVYDPPTSNPVELPTRTHVYHFAKDEAHEYFGNAYRIVGTLTIISSSQHQIADEDYTTTADGCLTRNDPYYHNQFNCIPPDSPCS